MVMTGREETVEVALEAQDNTGRGSGDGSGLSQLATVKAQGGGSGESPQPRKRRPGGGRKPSLDAADLQVLANLVAARPTSSLVELVAALATQTGKTLSKNTIARELETLGIKKVHPPKPASSRAPQTPPRYGKQHRREPTGDQYPSSLTDEEWQVIQPFLAWQDRRGRPLVHDKRLMMDALFYITRSGCQWRMLPSNFPPWQAVWSQFRRLRDFGTLDKIYEALHALYREKEERSASPTVAIVDSQTVKTTEKGGLPATMQERRSGVANGTWR